jgi:hypothetical protein
MVPDYKRGDPNDAHAESFDYFHRPRFFQPVGFLGIW